MGGTPHNSPVPRRPLSAKKKKTASLAGDTHLRFVRRECQTSHEIFELVYGRSVVDLLCVWRFFRKQQRRGGWQEQTPDFMNQSHSDRDKRERKREREREIAERKRERAMDWRKTLAHAITTTTKNVPIYHTDRCLCIWYDLLKCGGFEVSKPQLSALLHAESSFLILVPVCEVVVTIS